ncbi:MAG: hypothetical protein A2V77_06370 [Anaeromyxobacter sp. RBG_16_69_14]|nr:MAG: hypothetical protein A2V77_06370 [Anaeromyxobacter sp. RBG_16_69_14]
MADQMGSTDPDEIAESVSALKEQVAEAVQLARERLEIDRRMRDDPWLVLGVAAGAGFVLGGGLWPALRPLVKAAARAALAPSNLIAIAAAVGAMRAGQAEEEEATEGEAPTSH